MSPEVPKPEIIDQLPGVTRTEVVQPDEATQDRIVRGVDFKGDPSHVIGHPGNPTTEMTQAYAAEHLAGAEVAPTAASEVGGTALSTEAASTEGLITEADIQRLREGSAPEPKQ